MCVGYVTTALMLHSENKLLIILYSAIAVAT